MTQTDLSIYGIKCTQEVVYNPSYEQLFSDEMNPSLADYEKAYLTNLGAVSVFTGKFTGRSPRDKYFVMDETTRDTLWWTSEEYPNDNKPITPQVWKELKQLVVEQLSGKKLYVVDCFCGASNSTRIKIRLISEVAWQAHFVKNMYIQPTDEELENFGKPDFVILNGSKTVNRKWEEHGMNSENFVAFNMSESMQLIGGTWYGGEMKKGVFSCMNYWLPLKGIASMHCSANVGQDGDTAVFFGLSGTGKTTLSTDPERQLIGDDEHGWDDEGVFNFEGGCYAKCINMSKESEPDIWNAITRDALLENVKIDSEGNVDFMDGSLTENTRVSYPLCHIHNIVKPVSKAGPAKKVIFLTADAFGILPPVSKLTDEQAQYYFLSGFTSKQAGTERGITKPTPTFSACFGVAFLTLHPTMYAKELSKKMQAAESTAYLVNTGWDGRGDRMSLKDTRRMIDAILDGTIDRTETFNIPFFNLAIPIKVDGVETAILDPRNSYDDPANWDAKAQRLSEYFILNFWKFTDTPHGQSLVAHGPKKLRRKNE